MRQNTRYVKRSIEKVNIRRTDLDTGRATVVVQDDVQAFIVPQRILEDPRFIDRTDIPVRFRAELYGTVPELKRQYLLIRYPDTPDALKLSVIDYQRLDGVLQVDLEVIR